MKIFNELTIWRLFSFSALLTLILSLVVAVLYTLATPKIMMNFAVKNFWLDNFFLYIGMLLIGVFALRRMRISLLIGIALLYKIGHQFYIAFIWSTATSGGFSGLLLYISIVLSVIVELFCIGLIFKTLFDRK